MLWSSLYLVLRQLLQLVVLLGRSQRSKELEILLHRHELAILRRQKPRPLEQLGVDLAATTVRKVLLDARIPPATERETSWRQFLRQRGERVGVRFLHCRHALPAAHLRALLRLARTAQDRAHRLTGNPSGSWVTQQARNLSTDLAQHGRPHPEFLIHDRDSKFSRSFDDVFCSDGTTIIRTPIHTPNANAYAERWVRTVRNDCLDRLLILGRRQLEHVLRVYVTHYNEHRPHRSLDLRPPNITDRAATTTAARSMPIIQRRDLLGGLVREYAQAA